MDKPLVCKGCGAEVHPLAVFPGQKCLRCHEKAFDATPEEMEKTIIDVFGRGKGLTSNKRKRGGK